MRTLVHTCAPAALVAAVAGSLLSAGCQPASRTDARRLDEGRKIFVSSCAMCHGPQGSGDGPLAKQLADEAGVVPPRLNDPARLSQLGRDGVKRIIMEGGGHEKRSSLMPAWGEQLGPAVAEDVAEYVMALPELHPGTPAATVEKYLEAPPGSPEEGHRLFVYYCSGCHGLSGKGDGPYASTLRARHKVWPRNLTETAYFSKKTDQEIYVTVALGGGHAGLSTLMPAWTVTLSPEQIRHLVSYVRALSKTQPRP